MRRPPRRQWLGRSPERHSLPQVSDLARANEGRTIRLLIAGRNIRIIDQDGQLLRELTLDPTRCYQPIHNSPTVHDLPAQQSGMS